MRLTTYKYQLTKLCARPLSYKIQTPDNALPLLCLYTECAKWANNPSLTHWHWAVYFCVIEAPSNRELGMASTRERYVVEPSFSSPSKARKHIRAIVERCIYVYPRWTAATCWVCETLYTLYVTITEVRRTHELSIFC